MCKLILSFAVISLLVTVIYRYRHLFINSNGNFIGLTDSIRGVMKYQGPCAANCYQQISQWEMSWRGTRYQDTKRGYEKVHSTLNSDGHCTLKCQNDGDYVLVDTAFWGNGYPGHCGNRNQKADFVKTTEKMKKACDGKKPCTFVIKGNGHLIDTVSKDSIAELGNPTDNCPKTLQVFYTCGPTAQSREGTCPTGDAGEISLGWKPLWSDETTIN